MPIPPFAAFMLPLLRSLSDGEPRRVREVVEADADDLGIPEEERLEQLASGHGNRARNRTRWSLTYLKHAGLIAQPARGLMQVTEEGRRVLASGPDHLDIEYLSRYPSFRDFQKRRRGSPGATSKPSAASASETPDEQMERLWQERRDLVAGNLLERIADMDPGDFESMVVRVLVAMGYGGSFAEAASVVGRSGDGGIDGIIKEDRLGLDAIYVQAKRWQAVVGRPVVQQFAGSLEGARATKGVFITNSTFTDEARKYAGSIGNHIVLVDGDVLAGLMIEYGIGVTVERTYAIPIVDETFFEVE